MLKLQRLHKKIIKCKNCELYKTRTNAVPGEGDPSTGVLIIGEAPGKKEDEEGVPFIGRAGSVLTEILEELKIGRNSIFITNIIKCRPPKNRVPKKPEVEACRNYLIKQIDIIKPKLIIALGQSAFKTLTGLKGNMKDFHGKIFEFYNYPILITYHPAAVVYNRNLRPVLKKDLKRIKKLMKLR